MPERGLIRMELQSEPAPEADLRSPEGEEAKDRKQDERTRKRFFESLLKSKLSPAILALAVLSPRALESLKESKAGKLALDDLSLKDVAAWEDRPKLEGLPSYEAMRRELAEAIGEEKLEKEIPVHTEDYINSIREMRRAQERSKEPLAVQGFEEQHGVPDEDIRRIVSETYPLGWTGAGTVSSINASPEVVRTLLKQYGKTTKTVNGICKNGEWKDPTELFLTQEQGLSYETTQLVGHELAHTNDWNRSNTLSPEDRLTLLYLVHARISSPNHLRFPYVESIRKGNRKDEHLQRCTEYFAELMGFAFDIPARTKEGWERRFRVKAVENWAEPEAHPSPEAFGVEDLKLVNWYLNKVDPAFKPWEASEKRQELIRSTMLRVYERETEASLAPIPSPALRASLFARLGDEDRLERKVADVFAGTSEGRDAPDEIVTYIERYESALSDEVHAFEEGTTPRLRTAQDALHHLVWTLDLLSKQTGALASVSESGVLGLMKQAVKKAEAALHGCTPEEMDGLARDIRKRADILHGRIAFNERPPASFGPYVERLKDKGFL